MFHGDKVVEQAHFRGSKCDYRRGFFNTRAELFRSFSTEPGAPCDPVRAEKLTLGVNALLNKLPCGIDNEQLRCVKPDAYPSASVPNQAQAKPLCTTAPRAFHWKSFQMPRLMMTS